MAGRSQAVAKALSTKSTPFAAFTRAARSEASAPASRPCPAAAWRPPNAGGSRRCPPGRPPRPPVPGTAEQESHPAGRLIYSSLTEKLNDSQGIYIQQVSLVTGSKLLVVDFAQRRR